MAVAEVAMDALRIYIRELRTGRGVTQEELAEVMGLSLRAFTSWESGRTDEIKSGPLFRAATFLRASANHLYRLGASVNTSAEQAIEMAKDLLRDTTDHQSSELFSLSKEDQEHFTALATRAKASGKLAELISIIEQLESDPEALDRLAGYSQSLLDSRQPGK